MKSLFLILFFLFLLGCAHKTTVVNPTFKVGDNLEMTAKWLKDKEEKFDVFFILHNLENEVSTLTWHDFSCGKGEAQGIIPKKKFIWIKKGAVETSGKGSKELLLTCMIQTDLPGNFFIGLNKNFGNPKAKAEFVKWYIITK